LSLLVAYFLHFDEEQAKFIVDNPNHYFDGDNLFDAEECDDSNEEIGLPVTFYQDLGQGPFQLSSVR